MNTYGIEFEDHIEHVVAETPGKAKYKFYKQHEIDDCMEFGDYLKCVRCFLIHKFKISDLFTQNVEMFERMREQRGIEFACIGMTVEVNGHKGIIVGSNSSLNLDVCFDGSHCAMNCHPHYKVKYFDINGNLIKEYEG